MAPEAPTALCVVESGAEHLSLRWNVPFANGGSPITHYVIEWRTTASLKSADLERVEWSWQTIQINEENSTVDGRVKALVHDLRPAEEYDLLLQFCAHPSNRTPCPSRALL